MGEKMDGFVFQLMSQLGYLGMFLGMVLEAVIIVIPSEFILATAGILASRKIFSFWLAFLTFYSKVWEIFFHERRRLG